MRFFKPAGPIFWANPKNSTRENFSPVVIMNGFLLLPLYSFLVFFFIKAINTPKGFGIDRSIDQDLCDWKRALSSPAFARLVAIRDWAVKCPSGLRVVVDLESHLSVYPYNSS